jgi:AraC-like DNA-binding protein
MDPGSVPEAAIAAYERLTGCRVTVHDIQGRIRRHLAIDRLAHRMPQCQAAKATASELPCLAWDQGDVPRRLDARPDGLVSRCPAGLVELAAPVRCDGIRQAVLFAGSWSAGPDLRPDLDHGGGRTPRLPPLTQAEARDRLELLRQLALRLAAWMQGHDQPAEPDRHARILRFIESRHRERIGLTDLAAELRLSPSRAAHVVQAACGRSFLQLVIDARLERAAALLRHSDLDVTSIALDCGFGDVSRFHHAFRRRYGTTPLRFRAGRSA